MLNYNTEIEHISMPLRIKRYFIEGVKNKDYLIHLSLLMMKTLLFVVLISDDKANGVNFKLVFYSVPPLLVWIAIITLFLSLAFFFKGRVQKWIFWSFNLLFTAIVIGDIWYFRSNSVFLNYYMFQMASNLENLGSSIISMIRAVDFLFIIDLVVLAIKNFKINKEKTYKRNIAGGMAIILLSSLYLVYVHIKVDKMGKGFENQLIFRGSWSPNQTMSNITPIGYHIMDYFDFKEKSAPYTLSEEEKEEVASTINYLKENGEENQYKGIFKDKNLLIIQWESLETFVIGQKVNGQEITPNLNKLLNNSLYFNNFYEQTYSGTSSDAELIVNTSVFPVREGTTFFRYPYNTYDYSLPNIFEEMGYETLASHPDKGSYWNWMPNLKSIGYNKCIDSTNYDTSDQLNLGVSDKSYFKQFGNVVKELESPFLAYTVTLSSHAPFLMPKEEQVLEMPSNIEGTKLDGYFQSIHYTDKYLGELLKDLDDSGVLENTVVAIYGDHEGVHKFYNDEIEGIGGLEEWMVKNERRIPFIIYNKDTVGKTFDVIGGQVDTLPTLAYLFGVEEEIYNSPYILGRNLLNTKESYVLLSNREVISKDLSKEKEEKIKSLIDISDKLIRGNYYRKESGLYE